MKDKLITISLPFQCWVEILRCLKEQYFDTRVKYFYNPQLEKKTRKKEKILENIINEINDKLVGEDEE